VQRWNLQHIEEGDRPAWYASFGARTPVEIIAALTDPAAHRAADADACEPLADSDWVPVLGNTGWVPVLGNTGLVSLDGTARVKHFVGRTTDC
jgi:hypothetical protein